MDLPLWKPDSWDISSFLCSKANNKNNLEVLDALDNFLSGELSSCWVYWQILTHLNLGSNNLSGGIPNSMDSLTVLKSLRLQNNYFFGYVPSSLLNCTSLGLIYLVKTSLQELYQVGWEK
ncbi:unnamed protein product [Ilex paraguariensis]|uniref:Uncharacterized protein n=1 Tax=Ilex paraguariensis TaxID=185542 RepID=A0ABC8T1H8_9AQUA